MAETRVKKASLACDPCRKRKRKCDGRAPICSLCEKGGYECVYDTTLDQRRPAQKNYVVALEARVALLESILKNAGASDAVDAVDLLAEDGEPVQSDVPAVPDTGILAPEFTAPTQTVGNIQDELESSFIPADDAANVLESISLAKPELATETPLGQLDLGMADWVPLISLDAEHKLLAQFWDWQRMHLPYVAPVPFLSAYAIHSEAAHPNEPIPPPPPPPPQNPFSGPSAIGVPRAASVEPAADLAQFISPLLLDASFAIAALFTGDPETSEKFYRRAENRVLSEVANPRLATVQAMIVMATWELGHARAPATWTLMGVACALCVRLGMNVDATPLLRRGVMSKRLFETRNFVFWATYNMDRFSAMCMGMHPLMDKRMISTPRHSSLATANIIEPEPSNSSDPLASSKLAAGVETDRPTASDANITWWNPGTLGMGDVVIQAGWEAIRDLVRMSDMLFDGIYAFDAPKRTPQEDLELVTRNNLTVQRFLDELPTWLRSTGAIRRKENGLVYLHLFTHLTSIVASRPFLSPRPLSEEAMRVDATANPIQPTHSSHIIRRYRTLAFRVARASALQITSLVRHIPLSSPCVTLPYVVYSACTILLLAPDDPAAMDGVRTGVACLECMDNTGYWVNSAKDARDRVQALAERWGVNIISKKKALGHVESRGASGPGDGESGAGGSGDAGGSATGGTGQAGLQDAGTKSGSSAPSTTGNLPPSTSGATGNNRNNTRTPSSATLGQSSNDSNPAILQTPTCVDNSNQPYTELWDTGCSEQDILDQRAGPPSYDDSVTRQAYVHQTGSRGYDPQAPTGYSNVDVLASGMVQPTQTNVYAQPQAQDTSYMSQHSQQPVYSGQQPQPVQHVHYHFHSYMRPHSDQYVHDIPYDTHYQPNRLPHVAYAGSHADPQHDLHLAHDHWHQVLPPADPNLPFPLDPIACTDIAVCFADTVRTGQDPMFLQTMADPYADVAFDWFANAQDNFAPIMSQMYGSGMPTATSGSSAVLDPGSFGLYTQNSETGDSYADLYAGPSANHSSYGMPGV